jgi:hypothetical protein
MKDYFTYQGVVTLSGSRDAIREAFHAGLISNGDGWMETIKSRQKTVHSYNEQAANEIVYDVVNQYFDLFTDFRNTMKHIRDLLRLENELDDLLLPYKMDIALSHHIDNEQLKEHIRRVGVVFYERDTVEDTSEE